MKNKNTGKKIRFSSSSKAFPAHFTKRKSSDFDVLGSYTGTPSQNLRDAGEDLYPVQDADDL